MARKWAQIKMHWTVQKKDQQYDVDDCISVSKHFKVATHSSSNFQGIDKCLNTSMGVNVASDNKINLLLIYFKNQNS